MYNLARPPIERVVETKVPKVGRFVNRATSEATVGETLYRHACRIETMEQLDRGGNQDAFGVVPEFVVNLHAVEFADSRIEFRAGECLGSRGLHVTVHRHSKASVGLVGVKYPEIEHSEASVVLLVGIVIGVI